MTLELVGLLLGWLVAAAAVPVLLARGFGLANLATTKLGWFAALLAVLAVPLGYAVAWRLFQLGDQTSSQWLRALAAVMLIGWLVGSYVVELPILSIVAGGPATANQALAIIAWLFGTFYPIIALVAVYSVLGNF